MQENTENKVVELEAYKELKFVPWNYPPKPSLTARTLIEELNKLGRETYNLDGPSIEFRSGIDFIDISYVEERIAIEIDEVYHEDEERKMKDAKKNLRLKKRGWKVYRISYKLFEKYGPEALAKAIIKIVLKERAQNLRPDDLRLKSTKKDD